MALNVTGLSDNYYLLNNPIYVDVTGIVDRKLTFIVSFQPSPPLQVSSYEFNTPGDSLRLDIAPYLKREFDRLEISKESVLHEIGALNFNTGTQNYGIGNKVFIRGGRYGQGTNETMEDGEVLFVGKVLPFWSGFPSDMWKISGNELVSDSALDERTFPVKNCNRYYIRFLNRLGGVAHWLFEAYEEEISGAGNEYILNNRGFESLGNKITEQITVKSVFTHEFLEMAKDLQVTPIAEVYDEATGDWRKIKINAGSVKFNSLDLAYELSFSFEKLNRYEGSVRW